MDSKKLFIVVGVGAVAYFLSQKGKSDTAAPAPSPSSAAPTGYPNPSTPTTTSSILDALTDIYGTVNSAVQTGKDIFGQNQTPDINSLPSTTVPLQMPGTMPNTATNPVNNWGVPHKAGADVTVANSFNPSDGMFYKAVSDALRIYWEDIDALIGFDMEQSKHGWATTVNWYRTNPQLWQDWLAWYNRSNPYTRIGMRF